MQTEKYFDNIKLRVDTMSRKISRRSFLKRVGKVSIASIVTGMIGHFYIKHIEPKWIEITHQPIHHPLIPPSFNNFRIIQFSDTHLGFHLDFDQFEKIIQTISNQFADCIIFSGDLVDNLLSFFEFEHVILLLSQLQAPFGKFAVYGNHDHGGWGTEKYADIMRASGFTLLRNESVFIEIASDEQITLTGIDEPILGKPDIKKAVKNIPAEQFTILISHAPDLADDVKNYPVHLQISGHTHGGQVQMPLVGPLITPPMGQKYTDGFYELTDNFSLYVNRGLGTTRLPYRFLSRPEITLFTLHNKN